jgi:hypothetical protein
MEAIYSSETSLLSRPEYRVGGDELQQIIPVTVRMEQDGCEVGNVALCTSDKRPESIIAGRNLGVRVERDELLQWLHLVETAGCH